MHRAVEAPASGVKSRIVLVVEFDAFSERSQFDNAAVFVAGVACSFQGWDKHHKLSHEQCCVTSTAATFMNRTYPCVKRS